MGITLKLLSVDDIAWRPHFSVAVRKYKFHFFRLVLNLMPSRMTVEGAENICLNADTQPSIIKSISSIQIFLLDLSGYVSSRTIGKTYILVLIKRSCYNFKRSSGVNLLFYGVLSTDERDWDTLLLKLR